MKRLALATGLLLSWTPIAEAWDGWTLFQCAYDSITNTDYMPCEYKGTYGSSSACTAAGVEWCKHTPVNARIKEYCTNPANGTVTIACTRR